MQSSSREIEELHASGNYDIHTLFNLVWKRVGEEVFKSCSRQRINGRSIPLDDAKDLTSVIAVKIMNGLPGWTRGSPYIGMGPRPSRGMK